MTVPGGTAHAGRDAVQGTAVPPAADAARYDAAAIGVLAGFALLHVGYSGLLGLSPQEAYYWEWSRRLASSYFDHPPLASWTIRAATALLGESERGIRAAAAFHSLVFGLFFWRAARRMFGARAAAAALAGGLALPLFSLGQVVITPDGPLLSGWAIALYFTVRALDEERGPWLLAAGAGAGWAMLGKYTGGLLLPQILAALLLDARGRRLLRGPWPWAGAALALAIFSPVLAWNAAHGWASFAFQTGERIARSGLRPVLVGRFVGLQAALVTPIVLGLLVEAVATAVRRRGEPAWRVCALFSAPLLLVATAISPFHWVKGNWVAAAYPTALAAAAALALERRGWRLRVGLAGLGLAVLATVYLHLVPLVPALPFPARDEGSAGWRELAARVERERAAVPADAFVAGCSYKVSAELAYQLPDRPRTWSAEIAGDHGLQYRYWFDPAELRGRDGLVVRDLREKRTCAALAAACAALEPLEPLTVRRGNAKVTTFELWRCRAYAGPPAAR